MLVPLGNRGWRHQGASLAPLKTPTVLVELPSPCSQHGCVAGGGGARGRGEEGVP